MQALQQKSSNLEKKHSVKTLIISPFFFPDEIGIAFYNKRIADYLYQKGHQVTILTSVPYYPEWKIKPPYDKAPIFCKEKDSKATILRVKQYVPKRPTAFKRIIQLLHFTLLSFRYVFSIPKNSKIIVVTPFTSSIITALLVKFFRGGKILCHVQDFEFDAAIETLKLNRYVSCLFKIESFLFNKCDLVSTISNAMLVKLKTKTNTPSILFPNFIDTGKFKKREQKKHPYYAVTNKPQLLYSGNVGEKQDWNFFIRFVNEVKDDIDITIVGNGSMLTTIQNHLAKLTNVRFFNLVPYSELPQLLCSFDGHLLFQKKEVIDSVMPSKLIAMMLSGKPSFLYGNDLSESKIVVHDSFGGIYYSGNSLKEFSQKVKLVLADREKAEKMGKAAKKHAELNFSDKIILKKFENNLNQL
jgi:colanic acid biosynthesis glycosyl transferase WcaI